MRLHALDVTAFGPFGAPVHVDFDALSESGLFLLTGATGAGKTSVLDAVCFALYGEVPGDRQVAKRLRSDHAAPGVRPEVRLEATLAGRRFRIVRSPAWERPKKRGTGTTHQQAAVTIAERRDGEWVLLSNRLDETGHLVGQLVGMNLAQFCQVAMLPQGRFQAFLRARSEERHQLLEQLFRTRRFADVERWLREHRLALRRGSEEAHQGVAGLVSRLSEATDAPLPEEWDPRDLAAPAEAGEVSAWADGLCRAAAERAAHAEAEAADAARAEADARAARDRGRELVERRRRVDAALEEQFRLLVAAPGHADDQAVLDAARRAASVAAWHRRAEAADALLGRARAEARATRERAAALLGVPLGDLAEADGPAALESALAAAGEAAAAVRAALPREARLQQVVATAAEHETRLDDVAVQLAANRQAHVALPDLLTRARAALATADAASTRVPELTASLERDRERLRAAREVPVVAAELEAARADHLAATLEAQARRERWLDLREARIDGMAAEIATALAVGACCPVCGSADHPHKAVARPGSPTADDETGALKALDDAKLAEHAHDQRVRELSSRLTALVGAAGDTPLDGLESSVASAAADLERIAALAGEAERARGELVAVEAERGRLVAEQAALRTRTGELLTALRALRREQRTLRAEVAALLGGTDAVDLAGLLEQHLDALAAGREAGQAAAALLAAEAEAADAHRCRDDAAREAGFHDAAEAARAGLDAAEVEALARRVSDHDQRAARVDEVLGAPDVAEVLAAPPPDLPALAAAHERALEALADTGARASLWGGRATRLAALAAELDAALEAWAPVRARLALATSLAAFAEGKSPDNRLQMRLSAYVLAHRLGQVVAAANERLAGMSDQRYRLEHTGHRGAGETRGGLSLLVRDDWTGEARDPATLSGGETFVVSLALALGLADVVAHEAGGTDLDTLFVDEGFGALDADTLDDVLDTLDTLRDGGRVVGVVSHVPDMRDRIPTQLHVGKRRDGSTVRLVRAG